MAIRIAVPKGDYAALLTHLGRAREYAIMPDMQAALTEMLTAVEWDIAYDAVMGCMELGRSVLRDKLYGTVMGQIEAARLVRLNRQADQRTADGLPQAETRDYKLASLYMDVMSEIMCWIKLHLTFQDKRVEYNKDGWGGADLDGWIAAGRPPTYCILVDVLLKRYEKALEEKKDPKEFLTNYLTFLRNERRRQCESTILPAE